MHVAVLAAVLTAATMSPAAVRGGGGDFLFSGRAEKPRLRHYTPDGRLSLDVRGARGSGAPNGYRVTDVWFEAELGAVARPAGADPDGEATIRFVSGHADLATYDRGGGTLRLEGDVSIELHTARPVLIPGGAVGFPPAARLHVSRVRYNLETNIITSAERVWALFQGASGTTEVTGRGLEIDLTRQTLRIFEDARFLAGGHVLSAAALLHTRADAAPPKAGGEKTQKSRAPAPGGMGALITARHGAVIEGLGVRMRRDKSAAPGDANARALAPARQVRFDGPVSVRQDNLSLDCGELLFHLDEGASRIRASGGVRLRARERGAASRVYGFLAEAKAAQWDLPAGQATEKRGVLLLEGTAADPAEIVRRGIGQNVAAHMRLDLDTGEIEAGE